MDVLAQFGRAADQAPFKIARRAGATHVIEEVLADGAVDATDKAIQLRFESLFDLLLGLDRDDLDAVEGFDADLFQPGLDVVCGMRRFGLSGFLSKGQVGKQRQQKQAEEQSQGVEHGRRRGRGEGPHCARAPARMQTAWG
ncbi:MAG: hypothetical protein R3E96_15275 [Planctomycetota bacterium]